MMLVLWHRILFFSLGTLLLTRRSKASVGRVRLLLDGLAVIGVSLSLSWFFLLGPTIASLAQQPSSGAAILSIYFPAGDLFLVAVGALLMFSPLANRAQQSVFLLLCMGLFFLAITDSLLGFYNLSTGFSSGTLQDVLWPLSLLLIGLAAVEYPRSIAREQEQAERTKNINLVLSSHSAQTRISQFSMTAQTIYPVHPGYRHLCLAAYRNCKARWRHIATGRRGSIDPDPPGYRPPSINLARK